MKIIQIALAIAILAGGPGPEVVAQESQQTSNYVVVGAFSKLENAVRFTQSVNLENFQGQYAINSQRQLYYVFILNTSDQKQAFSFLMKIRVETKYKDAWVFNGVLGDRRSEPAKEAQPISQPIEQKPEPVVIEPVVAEAPKKDSVIVAPIVMVDSSSLKKPVEKVEEKKPDGKPFYFKLLNAETGSEVMGEVQIVESKATQYVGFKGNELVYLTAPKNSTGVYQVTIQAPGYKTSKLSFNYKDPAAVATLNDRQESVITFQLERAKKGDYIDFNNVRFFKNSAILDPSSQNELDGLVSLMKENASYKIRIHGHCNGDQARDIVTLGTSTNFFALDPLNGKENATAKRLTELRAETVMNYLVTQGIEQKRVTTKGEGGKLMIYPATSTLASYNDRVEIEIVKGK